jgi:hypothetical protein
MLHFRLSWKSFSGKFAFTAAIVLALASTARVKPVVQTAYTAPVLPPIFSAADLANSVTLMNDVQAAYNNSTTLLLAHDAQLFTLSQTLQNQDALILTLQSQVAALQVQVAALAPPVAPPAPTLITIQAESFNNAPAGQAGQPLACVGGSGTVTCNSAVGETLTYTVNIPTAGNYLFSVNASSNVGGTLTVNGTAVTIPNTGSFATFATTAGPILTLPAGTQILTVIYTTAHMNLDYYTLTQQ